MLAPLLTHPRSPGRQVVLFLPGLFAGPMSSPVITRLLARADRVDVGAEGSATRCFALFGIETSPDTDLPVAAVARIADMGIIDRDWWIRADPVYLEPHRDRLVLRTVPRLSLDEAERLAAELNESLALDDWLLRAPQPDRWYLKPGGTPAIVTTPLAEAVGQDVHPLLPRGADQRAWHTRLNELQILLHTASVNAEREKRGELPANSVWFWGGGRLPRIEQGAWQAVWADDPVSLGLARLSGIPGRPLPSAAAGVLENPQEGLHLVVQDHLAEVLLQAQVEGWSRAAALIVEDWLEPLIEAVHRGNLAALSIMSDSGPAFWYVRRHRWRFWRRPPQSGRLDAA